MMEHILELQRRLVQCAMPSGFEAPQAQLLMELARPLADEVYTDTLGNVICHKKGPGKKLMLAAHMDVLGLLITDIDSRGFLRFEPLGGHTPFSLIGVSVRTERGVRGSIWPDKDAGLPGKTPYDVDIHDLFIDLGAKDRAEAEALAPIGSVCVFDAQPVLLAGGNMMSSYTDDLSGCIALLLAMEQVKESPNDLYFVFSAQEEVGCRGGATAAFGIEPYMGFSVDVTVAADTPEYLPHQRNRVRLGGGPAIKLKDGGMRANPQAVEHLRRSAEAAGIVYQDEILLGGSTDARAMQITRSGVLASCVSIPCRNVHSHGEIVHLEDVRQAGRLLAAAAMRQL